MKSRHFIIIAEFIAVTSLSLWLTFSNERQVTAKVNKVEKIESTHGDKNGVTTEVYHLVLTDRGAFRVNINGFLAYPHLLGNIKADSTYTFKVVGIDNPSFGLYSSIVEVK